MSLAACLACVMLPTLFASSAMIEVGWRFFQEPVHKENERTMGFIVQSTKVAFVAGLQKLSSCQRRACWVSTDKDSKGAVHRQSIRIHYIYRSFLKLQDMDLSAALVDPSPKNRIGSWANLDLECSDWTQRAKQKRHHAAMLLGSNRHDFDLTNICWSIPYRLTASYSENSKTVCDSEDVFCGWLRGLTAEFMLSNFIHFLHSTPSLRCNIHHDQRAGWGLDLGCDDGGHTFAIFSSRNAWDWNWQYLAMGQWED